MRGLFSLIISILMFHHGFSQEIVKSIAASDVWGAYMIEGTSKVWLIDGIPERARLWDYEKDEIVFSVELKSNLKNANLMDDGSLGYIAHNDKNLFIRLKQDGVEIQKKFKVNAPSYYIHPNGQYFFGSIFEGYVTYKVEQKKISAGKLNETITGYSSKFFQTNTPSTFIRAAKDFYQRIDIGEDGSVTSPRALDKNKLLFSDSKDEILSVTPNVFKYYSLPDLELKESKVRAEPFDFLSGVYDNEKGLVHYFKDGKLGTIELSSGKVIKTTDIEIDDVYVTDRSGNRAICFSDSSEGFYILQF
ncbi:MAG: hypothetical protein JXQ96_22010 [Cyclobacteriaceae bacterium]